VTELSEESGDSAMSVQPPSGREAVAGELVPCGDEQLTAEPVGTKHQSKGYGFPSPGFTSVVMVNDGFLFVVCAPFAGLPASGVIAGAGKTATAGEATTRPAASAASAKRARRPLAWNGIVPHWR